MADLSLYSDEDLRTELQQRQLRSSQQQTDSIRVPDRDLHDLLKVVHAHLISAVPVSKAPDATVGLASNMGEVQDLLKELEHQIGRTQP